MKKTLIYSTVAACWLLISVSAMAAEDIKAKEYVFDYGDSVKAIAGDTFVVCGNCATDKLVKAPSDYVAIKFNSPDEGDDEYVAEMFISESFIAATERPEVEVETLAGTVLFSFDSGVLKKTEKAKLDKLITQIPPGTTLQIDGYACTTGKKPYNLKLSEQRAKTVAAYLKSRGAVIKSAKGNGECCVISKDKKLNRRVEIIKKEKK